MSAKTFLHVLSARHAGEYRLMVRFSDGSEKLVDLAPLVAEGGVFSALSSLDAFKSFFIDLHTVCWPSGADVAPEYLHSLGRDIRASEQAEAAPA